jgi:hypothetical protein
MGSAPAEQQLGGAVVAAARGMAGHGPAPEVVPNPLQKIVPPVSGWACKPVLLQRPHRR